MTVDVNLVAPVESIDLTVGSGQIVDLGVSIVSPPGPQGPPGPPGPPGPDSQGTSEAVITHINSTSPHPVYDDGPSLFLLYENAKV